MKFRLKLLLVVTVAAIGQIANIVSVNAETMPIEKLISQPKLASTLVTIKSLSTTSDLPTAKDLLARRKTRKPITPRKPAKTTPAATTEPTNPAPQSQTPAPTPATKQKQVLVSDIVIRSAKGQLDPGLESRVRQVLTVKTGQPTTRTELEQNLNAVRALGAFSAVEIIPEDNVSDDTPSQKE